MAFFLERDGGDRGGQCEYDMEIRNRQKFGLACGKPLRPRHALTLRAMAVAAETVGDAGHAEVVARLDVTTERGCVTRAHHAPFDAAQNVRRGPNDRRRHADAERQRPRGERQARSLSPALTSGVTSRAIRSNGLWVARIVWVATCV